MSSTGIVNIRGKQYRTVSLRVTEFREQYPAKDGWSIQTTLVGCDDKQAIVRAAIVDPANRLLATGHAQEAWSNTGVNSTSALENAETSAIGRALAAFGFAGEEFASADEVSRAIELQTAGKSNKPADVVIETPQIATQTEQTETVILPAALTDTAGLLEWFKGARTLQAYGYDDAAKWESVCAAVAKRFREVDDGSKEDESRKELLGLLQAERARLDDLTNPQTEPVTNATATDKPKRGRPRKAAA